MFYRIIFVPIDMLEEGVLLNKFIGSSRGKLSELVFKFVNFVGQVVSSFR